MEARWELDFFGNKLIGSVTTLHLIQSSSGIEVTLSNSVKSARVIRVLKRQDLVLLQLDTPSDLPFLNQISLQPKLGGFLYTMGYNGKGNLNTIIDRSLRLGLNSSGKLEGLVSPNVRKALAECGRPAPEIDILYLDGSLLPGFSGSPIIDDQGALVGVSDGGLEEGASSVSWGIPIKQLNNLLTSSETFPGRLSCSLSSPVSEKSSEKLLFASENLLELDNVDYLNFGRYKFIKTRTRTVGEMFSSVDDPLGLQQLIEGFSLAGNYNYLQFKFDIYEDTESGMTFCVPEGTLLEVEGNAIVGAMAFDGVFALLMPEFIESPNPNMFMRYVNSAGKFQSRIVQLDGNTLLYNKDFAWSYASGPIIKPGGIKVNRESYFGYRLGVDDFGVPIIENQSYSFQTHIGKSNHYLGAAVVNQNYTNELNSSLLQCVNSGGCSRVDHSDCKSICDMYKEYSKFVIGVHMSGFSNGHVQTQ